MNFWLILLCVFAGATVLWVLMNVLLFMAMGAVLSDSVNTIKAERKE